MKFSTRFSRRSHASFVRRRRPLLLHYLLEFDGDANELDSRLVDDALVRICLDSGVDHGQQLFAVDVNAVSHVEEELCYVQGRQRAHLQGTAGSVCVDVL